MKLNKSVFSVIILISCSFQLFANVGIFSGSGAGVELRSTDKIQMVTETVDIFLTRAGYRANGGADWLRLDKAVYSCRFTLKNLSGETVTVPVGFPLNGEYGLPAVSSKPDAKPVNQSEVVSRFNFIAGTAAGTYPVRYVQSDKEGKYRKLFLWDMTFKPDETIELLVSYSLSGYYGLALLRKKPYNYDKCYKHKYMDCLEHSMAEVFEYVTSTAKSWVGPLQSATFNLYYHEFEKYLNKRGVSEEDPDDPHYGKRRGMPLNSLFRKIEPEGWKIEQNRHQRYISWKYTDYIPEHNISISYFYTPFPQTQPQAEALFEAIKKEYDKKSVRKGNSKAFTVMPEWSSADNKNIADAILEFYGIKTDNPDIADFLESQIWYPATSPLPIDPQLKAYLMKVEK